MNYTLMDIKKLREEMGAALLDAKNALIQAETWDEALNLLTTKSDHKAQRVREAGRETREGGVFSYIHHNQRVGVLLELNCSTDFVARSESFQRLARELVLQIAGAEPRYITYEDVPAWVLREVRKHVRADPVIGQLPVRKRKAAIDHKLRIRLSEQVLLMQPWIKDGTVKVSDLVSRVIVETGENIVIARFTRYTLGESINDPAASGRST